jgi:Inner membrane protein YgaP-like, transmembrane domain
MGKSDKSFRLVLGSIIMVLGIYFQSWWGAIGLIPILTSVINWCPLYLPFGISTISKQKDS